MLTYEEARDQIRDEVETITVRLIVRELPDPVGSIKHWEKSYFGMDEPSNRLGLLWPDEHVPKGFYVFAEMKIPKGGG